MMGKTRVNMIPRSGMGVNYTCVSIDLYLIAYNYTEL